MKLLIVPLITLCLAGFVSTSNLAAPTRQTDGEQYTVQAGDWLSRIAQKYYGDVNDWQRIVEATNAKATADATFLPITDPNVIEIGQRLWIPLKGRAVPVSRVGFNAESSSASIQGTVQTDDYYRYAIPAKAEQVLAVILPSELKKPAPEIALVIFGQDGTVLLSAEETAIAAEVKLPSTQDYLIDVQSLTDKPLDFTLNLALSGTFMKPDEAEEPPSQLTLEALKNAKYSLKYAASGQATLNHGRYRERYNAEDATEIIIRLDEKTVTFGDLNGDGAEDAAVILATDVGLTGTFYDLAVTLNRNETPIHVASTFLGDQIQPQAMQIEAGQIQLTMLTHDVDDAKCCPSLEVVKTYRLEDEQRLESVGEE